MALQVREKEKKCIRVLPSLVAHAVGYEMIVDAHNTIYVQTHLAGSTMFAWYGKHRRLQYCMANASAYNTIWILTCLEGCIVPIWHGLVAPSCRCAEQGTILDIMV